MRASSEECEAYLGRVADLLERCGVRLTHPAAGAALELIEDAEGALSFELVGDLPADAADAATIEVREELAPIGDGQYQTSRYEYELIDRARDYRRAFHLHDPRWFERQFLVVVHEHCERPLGEPICPHFAGSPIRDAFAGVMALLEAWTAEPAECASLTCLE